jgi:Anti-sigma-K factor rskA
MRVRRDAGALRRWGYDRMETMKMRRILGILTAVLAAGALTGFLVAGADDGSRTDRSRTYPAAVDPAAVGTEPIQGASAELRVEGDEATLVADGLPEPEGSFQIWIMEEGSDTLEPSVLFVPRDGSARVAVPAAGNIDAVLVTREPKEGSQTPSEQPVLTIPLT